MLIRQYLESVADLILLAGFVIPVVYSVHVTVRLRIGQEHQLIATAIFPDGECVGREIRPWPMPSRASCRCLNQLPNDNAHLMRPLQRL
jgi:hypothetical protein